MRDGNIERIPDPSSRQPKALCGDVSPVRSRLPSTDASVSDPAEPYLYGPRGDTHLPNAHHPAGSLYLARPSLEPPCFSLGVFGSPLRRGFRLDLPSSSPFPSPAVVDSVLFYLFPFCAMDRAHRMNVRAAVAALSLFASVYAQSTVPKPGQPSKSNAPLGSFEIVGNSIVSAQQVRTLPSYYLVRD